MRILVTGGAGFLGSHLIKNLIKEHYVICLDNFFTGREENIEPFLKYPNFEIIKHDVCVPIFFEVDEIYNLACPASPLRYQYDSIFTMKTNFLGMFNMLELAKKNNARILQASTSEVYGDPEKHPQKESYFGNVNPMGDRSCYDEGKRIAETLCFEYLKKYGLDVKIARIFNTYGPNMDPKDGRVVSNFITQALKKEDITIYGKGDQTRSFCFVDDLIDGFSRFMSSGYKGVINLGNPLEYEVIDLARVILKMTNSSSCLIYKDLPNDDPKKRKPDIKKAKDILNWEPRISLEEGLKKTIEHFRDVLKGKERIKKELV